MMQMSAGLRGTLRSSFSSRQFHAASEGSNKMVAVLYEAKEYAANNPKFPGCTENSLGIRDWLQSNGHQYVVTADKEGPNCAYMTAERIKKAKYLGLLLTAGVGSDHIDLKAAADAGITVAEITGGNVVSVAEDILMRILVLLRNFIPGWKQVSAGEWNIAAQCHRAYDLEGKTVGTVGCGRIGRELLKRLKPFNCNLLYHDKMSSGAEFEEATGAKWIKDLDEMLPHCDVVSINVPLTDKTKSLINKDRIAKMKKGAILVNNSRGAIVEQDAIVEAVNNGHIAGYGGDVWYPQPAPKDHPWRQLKYHAMTPHVSGTTLDGQMRYSAGVKDVLDKYFRGQPFPEAYYIVREGKIASQYL